MNASNLSGVRDCRGVPWGRVKSPEKNSAMRTALAELALGGSNEKLDRECHRNTAGEFSGRRECAGGLQCGTRRTGTHRLLHRSCSSLSGQIGCCRWQRTRPVRRGASPAGDRNKKPFEGFKTSTKQSYYSWPGIRLHIDAVGGRLRAPPERGEIWAVYS
jgi:hypothetical protein